MPKTKHEGFEDLPQDDDTSILSSDRVEINGIAAVHERWSWDGTMGETLAFREKDLDDRSDDALRKMVEQSSFFRPGSSSTVSRNSNGFAFVNFNFQT